MGLFFMEDIKRFCIYNFNSKEILKVLHKGDLVEVLIDGKWVTDTIDYNNYKWCLLNSGYIGEDLNGLDVKESKNLIGALKSVIKNIFR